MRERSSTSLGFRVDSTTDGHPAPPARAARHRHHPCFPHLDGRYPRPVCAVGLPADSVSQGQITHPAGMDGPSAYPATPVHHCRNLEADRGLFRKLLAWGLIIGLGGNALYATLTLTMLRIESTWLLLLATVAQGIGAPLLMLAYVSALCLLVLSATLGKPLQVLTPVGQMALSIYLTQSIPSFAH